MSVTNLHWGDYISLGLYFVLVVGFGVWSFIPKNNRESVGGYFLAGRSMHWIPVGASLFASNIGSGHLIGLAGGGAASGIGIFGFEATAPIILAVLGWVFLPVYIRSGVFTMPQYLHKRFGGDRIRFILSILSLVLYVTTKISADLFSGALFIKVSFDLNMYVSIIILVVIAAVFSIGGGLSAVIWTDFIQTIIMIAGAFYLMIKSFIEVEGIDNLKKKYSYSVPKSTLYSNATCGLPRNDYFDILRSTQSDYPWPGMTFGVLINSIWYWCSDQVIVQRVLAAKNLTHARAGCVLASVLKFLPLFLIVLPGMISRVLFTDEVACATPEECLKYCGSSSGCSNNAYPLMIMKLMPDGARGLMLAVMMAALMSSLTSIFNSASAIFTIDIWKRVRKNAKDWELMVVGRVFVIILVVISILWIPILQTGQGSRLLDYIQSIMSYFAPPVSAVYLMAILFKRINEKGAFYGLIIGLSVGLVRSIIELSYPSKPCALKSEENRPAFLTAIHYLHFRFILFFLTIFVAWTVSLLTKPIPDKYIRRLTYFSINDVQEPIQIPYSKGVCCSSPILDDNKSSKENFDSEVMEKLTNHKKEISALEECKDESKVEVFVTKMNVFKKIGFLLCGINVNEYEKRKKLNEVPAQAIVDTSIDQTPIWSAVTDIGAILTISASGFILAFFNKYN